jgi:hypothetical protein
MKTRRWHFSMIACFALLVAFLAAAADSLVELQTHFDHENNSIHKAKLLEKLADAEFEETRRLGTTSDYNAIGIVLEKYRDNVHLALEALKKDHPDAERHYNGYRQVEICVRKGLHEVDQILLLAPDQYKPPIGIVRRDLAGFQDELIAMLFPAHHTTQPPPPVISTPPSEKHP